MPQQKRFLLSTKMVTHAKRKALSCRQRPLSGTGLRPCLQYRRTQISLASSALDHIHNVVAEREYQRGYKQAKEEYDHKLTEIKSRFKDRYYNKGYSEGYEQGKADAAPKWIPFTAETMPKEDGEYFVLYDDKYAEDYDTGSVGVADFYVDCEAFGYWQERYDPVTLGYVDSDFIEIKVKKWMPIPKDEEGKDDND